MKWFLNDGYIRYALTYLHMNDYRRGDFRELFLADVISRDDLYYC